MKPTKQSTEAAPKPWGAFRSDGSYNPNGGQFDRGPTDRLIRVLVRKRREDSITPEEASNVVVAANATSAFPSHADWAKQPHWGCCFGATVAETAVIHCGRGTNGHWCGGRFMPGEEKDCESTGHRLVRDRGEIQGMVAALFPSTPPIVYDPEHVEREKEKARAAVEAERIAAAQEAGQP